MPFLVGHKRLFTQQPSYELHQYKLYPFLRVLDNRGTIALTILRRHTRVPYQVTQYVLDHLSNNVWRRLALRALILRPTRLRARVVIGLAVRFFFRFNHRAEVDHGYFLFSNLLYSAILCYSLLFYPLLFSTL